jgi:HEAT repeat protein
MGLLDWLLGGHPTRQKLRSFDPDVRASAINQIGRSKDRGAVKLLIAIVRTDRDTLPRSRAADVLGELGDGRAVAPLIEVLRTDKHSTVRQLAAGSLGELGNRKALEPLTDALLTDSSVGRYAADALAELGDDRAMPALMQAVQNGDQACGTMLQERLENLRRGAISQPSMPLPESLTWRTQGCAKTQRKSCKASNGNPGVPANMRCF